MTTYAEGPQGLSATQRARDLFRDLAANSTQRTADPVSQQRITALTHETVRLVNNAPAAQSADVSKAIKAGMPPQVKDGQAHNDASSSASTRRGSGQGTGKGADRPGIGG